MRKGDAKGRRLGFKIFQEPKWQKVVSFVFVSNKHVIGMKEEEHSLERQVSGLKSSVHYLDVKETQHHHVADYCTTVHEGFL